MFPIEPVVVAMARAVPKAAADTVMTLVMVGSAIHAFAWIEDMVKSRYNNTPINRYLRSQAFDRAVADEIDRRVREGTLEYPNVAAEMANETHHIVH